MLCVLLWAEQGARRFVCVLLWTEQNARRFVCVLLRAEQDARRFVCVLLWTEQDARRFVCVLLWAEQDIRRFVCVLWCSCVKQCVFSVPRCSLVLPIIIKTIFGKCVVLYSFYTRMLYVRTAAFHTTLCSVPLHEIHYVQCYCMRYMKHVNPNSFFSIIKLSLS